MSQYEEAVVAAMFLEPAFAIPRTMRVLESRDFTDECAKTLFSVLCEMYEAGTPIDFLTLHHELESRGHDISIARIADLSDYVATARNVDFHTGFVRDSAVRRRMARALEIAAGAVEDDIDVLDSVSESIVEAQTENRRDVSFKDLAYAVVEKLDASQHGVLGLKTGFSSLDDMTGGLQDGDLVILAGRPSSGKTALMLDIVRHISKDYPVGVFSIEMSQEQLVQRIMSAQARIDYHRMRRHNMTGEQWGAVSQTLAGIQDRGIWIDDFGSPKIGQLCAAAKLWKSTYDIRAVFVDYLQLIHGEGESQQIRIGDVAQKLKALAKAIQVPVVALAQLNREVEHRSDGKPQLSDLRESGAIEQAADVAMFLWRPGMYKDGDQSETKLLIRKHRQGPTGEVDLVFEAEYTSFREAHPW